MHEGTEIVHPCHLKESEVSHLSQRALRGGHQTLVMVEIKKHLQIVAHLYVLRHIAGRQQDVAESFSTIQIHTEFHLLDDPQRIHATQFYSFILFHCPVVLMSCPFLPPYRP